MDIKLTPREAEILTLAAQGLTSRQIANALYLSDVHVKRCLSEGRCKLGAVNTAHAIAIAVAAKLIIIHPFD